jgi:hypothetical protein
MAYKVLLTPGLSDFVHFAHFAHLWGCAGFSGLRTFTLAIVSIWDALLCSLERLTLVI